MVPFRIAYLGDLRTQSTHGPSGTVQLTDAPVDNQGKGEAFSPTDNVASALASCMMTILGIVARRDGLDLTGMHAEAEKHMTATAPRRIARIVVRLHLPAAVPEDRRAALQRAAHTCPVALSLHPEVVQDVSFTYDA
jgi:putative redox protein